MVINVEDLKGRIAKPKFIPRSKRKKTEVVLQKAVQQLPAEKVEEETIPQWRLEKEALIEEKSPEVMLSWADKPLSEMSERDWKVLARDFDIETSESTHPLRSWNDLSSEIKDIVSTLGYKEPTSVQRATIPLGLEGRDIVGIAETGSGKTAGFVIPLVSKPSQGVYGLVLAPTRELAQQIHKETLKFTSPLGIKAACLVGGHDIESQANAVIGAQIVIATPGRLLDALAQEMLSLAKCRLLVLDEADRMVDMGFEEQVTEIVNLLPKSRQTLMFSATWPPVIEKMATTFLTNPVRVTIGGGPQANTRVTQTVELVEPATKLSKLQQVLGRKRPVIVFVNQKATVDQVAEALNQKSIAAAPMHGDRTQEQRETALNDLRSGKIGVLVATDVAGRGIDIPNVQLVVNYDMPRRFDAYVHRIGRTGRAGRSGTAISLVTESDSALFPELKSALQKSRSPIPTFLK